MKEVKWNPKNSFLSNSNSEAEERKCEKCPEVEKSIEVDENIGKENVHDEPKTILKNLESSLPNTDTEPQPKITLSRYDFM